MAKDSRPASFIGRLSSFGGGETWELHCCTEPTAWCPLRMGPAPDDDGETTRWCLDLRTTDDAVQWLSMCASNSDDMRMLRGALRDSTSLLSGMTDHRVVDLAATMIARRELCVVAVRTIRAGAITTAKAEPARSVARTPSQYRPRNDEPIPESDVPNVRAAMLIEAARTGVPFCEH